MDTKNFWKKPWHKAGKMVNLHIMELGDLTSGDLFYVGTPFSMSAHTYHEWEGEGWDEEDKCRNK